MTIRRLSEVRNEAGELTHLMCCVCFIYTPVADLWVCPHGHRWDMCGEDGMVQSCPCSPQEGNQE